MVMEKIQGKSSTSESQSFSKGKVVSQMMSQVSVPMLEVNIRKYNMLTKDSAERALSPEDCCTYCDHYQEGAMTESKKFRIEKWRQNVHQSAAVPQRPRNQRKKQKLKFMKYTPPGMPEEEPNQERMSKNGWSRHVESDGIELTSLSSDLHHMSLDGSNGPQTSPMKTKCSKRMNVKGQVMGCDDSLMPTSSSSPKTYYTRSMSNALLNCLTIDDYKSRYGGSYSRVGSLHGRDVPPHVRDSTVAENNAGQSESSDHLAPSSVRCSHRQSSTAAISQNARPGSVSNNGKDTSSSVTLEIVHEGDDRSSRYNMNLAVQRGFQVLLTEEQGELQHRDICGAHNAKTRSTRRFQRLHRNLHRWMEEEILQLRPVSQASSLRHMGQQPRPVSQASSLRHMSQQEARPPRDTFREKSNKAWGRNDAIPEKKSQNTEEGKGNLLEMLMEIDSSCACSSSKIK